MSEPYKVVAYEPGAANVIDRATGERIGYVLQDFYSKWKGYLCSQSDVPVVRTRYREDAARFVFLARSEPSA